MYYCVDCEQWFETPKFYEECVGEFWGAPAYMSFDICPNCSSDNILDEDEYYKEYGEESEEE